jgi:hypothetical protein
MRCTTVILSLMLFSALAANAQSQQVPPPPQSPRQALLEMFFGSAPNHVEKHLPEIARKAFQQLDTGSGPNFLGEISMIASQARAAGSSFQTFDSGPTLLLAEEPRMQQKIEVLVEQDNLVGEENQIDLSFHMYRSGLEERLPIIPRLTFMMKPEKGVWRLNEVSFTARMPLGDPDFLKGFVKDLKKKQQSSNESMASWSIRTIISAENAYHAAHSERGYSCSLSELAQSSSEGTAQNNNLIAFDSELVSGKKNGYVFALTGCDGLHYKVAAEPATPAAGQRAYCADESGEIKFAPDGKATTCLSRGQSLNDAASFEATTIE